MRNSLKTSAAPANESPYDRRKGKRLYLNFSIEISGTDRKGQPFIERTKTDDVSDDGCRLHTNFFLESGFKLDIRLILPGGNRHPEDESRQFEIMWVVPEEAGWSLDAHKIQDGKIWKVSFPPRSPRPNFEVKSN